MMAYYFSKSFLSFYNTAITAVANMPGDVVPISVQTYESMQLAIKAGLVIKADANGMPVAVEPQKSNVVLTPAQQIAQYATGATAGAGYLGTMNYTTGSISAIGTGFTGATNTLLATSLGMP